MVIIMVMMMNCNRYEREEEKMIEENKLINTHTHTCTYKHYG